MFLRRSFSIFGQFVPVMLLCAVMSCVQEAPDADNQQSNPDGLAPKLSIEDARMFFTDYAGSLMFGPVSGPRPETKGSGDSGEDVSDPREPSWEGAEYVNLFGEDIIDVPFDGVAMRIDKVLASLPMPEIGEMPEISNPNTLLRLAAGLSEIGEIYYIFVYATPTDEWLSVNGLTIATMSLADIGDNYSGEIRYYTPDGEFLMGFVCENGWGIRTLELRKDCETCGGNESGSDSELTVTLNAMECTYTYEIWGTCFANVIWKYLSGEITVVYDECSYELQNFMADCVYVEDDKDTNNPAKDHFDPPGPGGAGGGKPDTNPDPPAPKEEPKDPCGNLNFKKENPAFSGLMDAFRDFTDNQDFEVSTPFEWTGDGYNIDPQQGTPGRSNVSFSMPGSWDGALHTHPSGNGAIFSGFDLYALSKMYMEGHMNDPSTFMFGLITPDGYILAFYKQPQ